MRSTADYHLANDIMQESFKRYLEHYGSEHFSTPLLFRIARNALLDKTRTTSRGSPYEDEQNYGGQNPERYLMIRDEYRRVLAAMQQLESSERDCLALVVSSDLSYREIAALTGTSEANIKVKVHRARVKIKKILQEDKP